MAAAKKTAPKKEKRNRTKGGFTIFKEITITSDTGDEIEATVVIASELKNQLDCETWLKKNADSLDPESVYLILQLKKTVRVKIETIKRVTVK